MPESRENLGSIIRHRRRTIPLTLLELARLSGVSVSHLARIESGERFPSASVLRHIAKPLRFTEQELLILAGYMTPELTTLREEGEEYAVGRLDMRVAKVLAQEPVEVQRAVLKMLPVLKSIAREIAKSEVEKGKFSKEELGKFNGKNNPPYIAYKGKVYDVSHCSHWKDGIHQGLHEAGCDLTRYMKDAPHGEDVLDKFPLLGDLEKT